MRKTTAKKMMLGIASTCFFVTGSMMAIAGTWQQTGAGWTYLKDNHQYANNELVTDNNQLYFLGADGIMKTGFVPVNGVYYYFTPAGNMQTGWVFDNNAWYYMQTDAAHFGQMTVNASQNVNGKNYYFGADGRMVHDTTIGQTSYGADGAAVTYNQNTNGGAYEAAYGATDYLDGYSSTESGVYVQFGNDNTMYAVGKDGSLTKASNYSQITTFNHDECVEDIFKLTNQERLKAGLSELSLSDELNEIADERAMEIAKDYSHSGFHNYVGTIRSIFGNVSAGENITGARSASEAMKSWINSSGHRDNMLSSDYSNIGIGAYQSGYYIYFVQIFAG